MYCNCIGAVDLSSAAAAAGAENNLFNIRVQCKFLLLTDVKHERASSRDDVFWSLELILSGAHSTPASVRTG